MSRKANCWDNAVMERVFLNLKMERVWQRDYRQHGSKCLDAVHCVCDPLPAALFAVTTVIGYHPIRRHRLDGEDFRLRGSIALDKFAVLLLPLSKVRGGDVTASLSMGQRVIVAATTPESS